VLTATSTSTSPVVTVSLDASQQTEVRAAITLPGGQVTPGVVTSVGKVAATAPGSAAATIPVQVSPTHPRVGRGLDQAPVTVAITTGIVHNALVVPATALLAESAGGYDVELAGADGHHLVLVSLGLTDSAAGLVAVTGPGLAAGQRVVVPQL
jgi:hypothetical protein